MDTNNQYLHEVAITAIIVKDNKYLITRRSANKKRFPGMWTVPGGKMETNDYLQLPKDTEHYWYNVLERTLRREVKEEAGIELSSTPTLIGAQDILKNDRHVVRLTYVAPIGSVTPVLSDEHDEYAWFTLDEIRSREDFDKYLRELLTTQTL